MDDLSAILPRPFLERMKQILKDETDDFVSSLGQEPPVSIRLNPFKFRNKPGLEEIPWCKTGYYLPVRPSFTLDPLFHAGAYYVQEPGSMFLEQVFRQVAEPDAPLLVLDLCGAPGGKSTHLLSLMNRESLLVANEVIRTRAAILSENIRKWGNSNVVVTNNDPRYFAALGGIFDIVVVDAPCSGEGLFRKDKNAISEWSPDNANLCSARQKRILSDAWECLKPGGYLIYSTCTYNPEENENNLAWLTEKNSFSPIDLSSAYFPGIKEISVGRVRGYQLMPHRVRGEGFFIGALQKTNGKAGLVPKKRRFNFKPAGKDHATLSESWLVAGNDLLIVQNKNQLVAFGERWLNHLDFFASHLSLPEWGCPVAERAGNSLNPLPGLALSIEVNQKNFKEVDFDLDQSIGYLRRDTFPVNLTANGWYLVNYKQIPMGWIKFLGTRFNNYYPANWRIRMAPGKVPFPWHNSVS